MVQVNRTQFKQIKTHFKKLRSELNKEKLAEFETNLTFFAEYAPYATAGDLVTRQEFNELAKEVSQARRASLIRNGETSEYSRYKANSALGGIDRHPDCKSHTHAEIMSQLRTDSKLRELANGLGGLTKEQLKGELPA
jgi:hypothetical protein